MMNIREFIQLVGRDAITGELGFRPQDVSRAMRDGVFPSGWYVYIRDLCHARGLDTPDHLFRWSSVPDRNLSSQSVGAA